MVDRQRASGSSGLMYLRRRRYLSIAFERKHHRQAVWSPVATRFRGVESESAQCCQPIGYNAPLISKFAGPSFFSPRGLSWRSIGCRLHGSCPKRFKCYLAVSMGLHGLFGNFSSRESAGRRSPSALLARSIMTFISGPVALFADSSAWCNIARAFSSENRPSSIAQ